MKTLTRAEKKAETARKRLLPKLKEEFWGTQDELRYLKNIGKHLVTPSSESRKFQLRRYAKAMEGRVNWGHIDPQIIKDYLMLELGVKG